MDRDGNTYEKAAIEEWIRCNGTNPKTRAPMTLEDLTPNRALVDLINNLEIDDGEEKEEREQPVQVFVKDLDGKSRVIETLLGATVQSFKEKVAFATGVPRSQQRLLYGGKELSDNSATLASYKVARESTIHMVLRLLGGAEA